MVKEFTQRAVNEWNNEHPNDAMYNLGIALHLVQDMTVPHHVHLMAEEHSEYERYVWEKVVPQNLHFEGKDRALSAEEWVEQTARITLTWDRKPNKSAQDSLRLGVSSSVGFILSYFSSFPPINLKFDVKTPFVEKGALAAIKAGLLAHIHQSDWASNEEIDEDYSLWLKDFRYDVEGNTLNIALNFEVRTPAMFTQGDLWVSYPVGFDNPKLTQ